MRWGLIGASTIAREWVAPAIVANGGTLVGVYSTSLERGEAYAAQVGVQQAYDSLEQMLDQGLDAVYISTTNELHRAQVEAAAARGIPVYCEKPLATTLADAQRMIEACAEAGVAMATNHHLRHAGTHRRMRDEVAAGHLGRPVSARVFHAVYLPEHLQGWRLTNPSAGAGVVLDITVHNADTLAFILGEYQTHVMSQTQNCGMGSGSVEDGAMGIWRFPSGLQAFTHEAFTMPHAHTGLEVHGSDASLYADNVMTQKPVGTVTRHMGQTREVLPTPAGNLYEAAVKDFVEAIARQQSPACDGVAGYRSMAVAVATLKSAELKQEVEVDYGPYSPF